MLYLTANPESVEKTVEHPDGSVETDGVWLRVDFEVRQVKDLLKKSKYRDLVIIEHLPAATTMDNDEGNERWRRPGLCSIGPPAGGERSVTTLDARYATFLSASNGTFGMTNGLLSTYGPGQSL